MCRRVNRTNSSFFGFLVGAAKQLLASEQSAKCDFKLDDLWTVLRSACGPHPRRGSRTSTWWNLFTRP